MTEGKVRRVWVIGFAGHRAIADAAATKAAILAGLRGFRENAEGVVVGRASAAAGADLLFLECCRDLGLAYSVVLPLPKDRFRLDFDDDAEWTRAEGLMAAASNTEVAPGNEVAPEAYHLAAREILDVADAMLFFWDGQPARGKFQVVAASTVRRPVHRPETDWLLVRRMNEFIALGRDEPVLAGDLLVERAQVDG